MHNSFKNENAKSYEKQFPGVQRAITKQHYVDDYVDSSDTVEEAISLASNIITVHKEGGFRLVKWISNSTEFMKSIPEEIRLPDYDKIDRVRMLGLQWNFRTDELVFDLNFKKFSPELLNGEIIPTKQEMLKFLMSIILPPKHPFTKLLVQWYHETNIHQGVDTVINRLREKFWIPTCRMVVKKAFKSCMMCRVKKPKVKLVEMGDIPKERSEKCEFPFTYTGLDYFGPIMAKYGRRYEKVYGALFTCLTTRGIHVELASSLTTNSALMALTRFMNLRGVPKKVFSDHGSNFVGADNELKEFIQNLDNETIQDKMSIRGVEWKFNCPAAPNRGGAWEGMVRSVKEGLKVLIETEFPSFEVLSTALSEVVNTINNRPLTYISSDADDFNIKAITPNDIILLRTNHSQYDTKVTYNCNPRETWKFAHQIADQFWHRWVKEYRPLLIKRANCR